MKNRYGPFCIALTFSVLLHVSVVVAELVQEWLWVPEHEETELRKTKKKLKSQQLDDPFAIELQKIKPVEALTVTLRHVFPVAPGVKPVAVPQPKKKKPAPKPIPVKVVKEQASAPAGVPVEVPVPPIAAVASAPAEVASAPLPVLVASAVVASEPASAIKPGAASIARFPRDVKMTYRWGFYVADMHWQVSDGRYDVSVDASGVGMFYRFFRSYGRVDRDGVHPEQFVEYRERSQKNPKYLVDFDYAARTVEVGEPGQRKKEPMTIGDKDIFAAAFHLALMGGDEPEYVMAVYTGRRRYDSVHFAVAGESTLSLGNQKIDAVLLRGKWDDRRFEFWLAPQWNNLPVRMNVVVPEYGSFDFWAQDITVDGKKVLEWTPPQQE